MPRRRTQRRVLLRRALVTAACVASPWAAVFAHPIHTTITVVTFDAQGATFTMRSFADDFSAVVAERAGRAAPRDSSVVESEVLAYMRSVWTVTGIDGRARILEPCGVRRTAELYWICVRVPGVRSLAGFTLRNATLMERYADQANVLQVGEGRAKRTLMFTRMSGAVVVR